jgi:hypothetical protein
MTRSTTTIRVSDHALLRFLERAGGLDVEVLRASIAASLARAHAAAAAMGADDMVVIEGSGLRWIIRDNVVVTLTGPRRR